MTDPHTPPLDIVARLRTRGGRPDGFGLGPVCDEAADEIERLREALKTAQYRGMVDERISYKGYSYGMRSMAGIRDLRSAIERDRNS